MSSQISEQVHLFENAVPADEAVRIGWTALRAVSDLGTWRAEKI